MKRKRPRAVLLAGLLAVLAVAAVTGVAWWHRSSAGTPGTQPMVSPSGHEKRRPGGAPGGQRPVKVFLLAGQSDMAGRGAIRTLDWLGEDPKYGSLLRKIKKPDGSWVEWPNVWVYYPRCSGSRKAI